MYCRAAIVAKRATEIITGAVRTVTEPFVHCANGEHQSALNLYWLKTVARLGYPRRFHCKTALYVLAEIHLFQTCYWMIAASRVCTVRSKKEQGGYRIYDEGSTSGTYINDVEVGMHGQMLKPDDRIGIGPTVYRFELQQAAGASPDSTTRLVDGRPGDITQLLCASPRPMSLSP